MIKIPPFIQNLEPYKAGKPIAELMREKKLTRVVKLASNENPIGPSPRAIEAIRNSVLGLNRYSDPAGYDLVMKIADKFKVQPNHVIAGHGTDSLLAYVVSAFTNEEDEIITSEGSFIGIYVSVRKLGRNLTQVPLKNYAFDLDAIVAAISDKTNMIYLANPNNPTGTMFTRTEFERFMEQVPAHIMVILDEAYTDYACEYPDYPNGIRYDYENLVITRTLSKALGLAGLRIGYAVGPDKVIESLYKVRLPFEPNYLAQQAAIAALDDDEFLAETIELNKQSLALFKACFDENGMQHVASYTNFILVLMPSISFAKAFAEACLDRGLIVRHVDRFGLPEGIRINSGTMEETVFATQVISEVYQLLLKRKPEGS
ncbi:MAG: histidinol-phosphate transaminase [Candidatus Marinimicrobia bacterium]|nr:histidinol-phosphate transaminase [Candidatus Neomarinimicrobiota bacterium]MCF7904178.1 histidinol-phosphate transaminase [Candidatus Neomarinimicrobiota bacterium]